jgi:hypothetical protein
VLRRSQGRGSQYRDFLFRTAAIFSTPTAPMRNWSLLHAHRFGRCAISIWMNCSFDRRLRLWPRLPGSAGRRPWERRKIPVALLLSRYLRCVVDLLYRHLVRELNSSIALGNKTVVFD